MHAYLVGFTGHYEIVIWQYPDEVGRARSLHDGPDAASDMVMAAQRRAGKKPEYPGSMSVESVMLLTDDERDAMVERIRADARAARGPIPEPPAPITPPRRRR